MAKLEIRTLLAEEARDADQIMKRAFGTFLGLHEPENFAGDSSHVRSRWRVNPDQVIGGFHEGELIGSNVVTRWGSFGFFGPLSIDPKFWGQGFASMLMEPIIDRLTSWGLAASGLFTFPNSTKHISLYEKFGFYSSYLTIILAKKLESNLEEKVTQGFDRIPHCLEDETLGTCHVISDSIFEGLDLGDELLGTTREGLGEVLVTETGNAFAICHSGKASEAGSGASYIKFGGVRTGVRDAANEFHGLMDLCETHASVTGGKTLIAGINAGRREAYKILRGRGYLPVTTGLSMVKPGNHPFSSPELFVIDDWR